jgi:GNAT superfamily N-acetyltransferase
MTPIDNPDPADIAALDDRLSDFNIDRTGITDARFLSLFLRTPEGELYAGLHGHSWGGCCEIKLIWVADNWRGKGIGAALLASAEAEAIKRCCAIMMLSTHSFQAPDFYRDRGFRDVAAIDNYPRGHAHIVMVKHLLSPMELS